MNQQSTMVMPVQLKPGMLATVRSESDPDKSYAVMVSKMHTVYCTCMAWKYSKGPTKSCKHLRAFLQSHPNVAEAAKRDLELEIFGVKR